jgi:hypothetical protein
MSDEGTYSQSLPNCQQFRSSLGTVRHFFRSRNLFTFHHIEITTNGDMASHLPLIGRRRNALKENERSQEVCCHHRCASFTQHCHDRTAYEIEIRPIRSRVLAGGSIAETTKGKVEYSVAGSGAPLLSIHGAGGGYDQGLLIAKALVADVQGVVANFLQNTTQ